MAKIKKTVKAGPLVKVVLYTAPEPRDGPQARTEKSRATTAARKRINDKTAKGRLEMLLAANFGPRDEYVTLTYDNEHLPKNRAEAEKHLRKYIKRLREYWKKKGKKLRYVYVTEHNHGDGRYHHHIMLSALGEDDIEILCSLWDGGRMLDVERVYEREFYQWGQYMAKETGDRPLGKRMWTGSKGLAQPIEEREYVSNDTALTAPPDCHVIETSGNTTEYGSYAYIKYKILPPKTTQRKPFYQEFREW